MKIGPPRWAEGISAARHPDVPACCSRCGLELHGCGLDAPDGWLCGIDCGQVADRFVTYQEAKEGLGGD